MKLLDAFQETNESDSQLFWSEQEDKDVAQFFGYLKLRNPSDWDGLAGAWVPGRSAYELAHSWQPAGGLPPSIKQALETSDCAAFQNLTLDLCLVEKPVFLDTRVGPSMTDIMAYGRSKKNELIIIGIEGKADESFGQRTYAWVRGDSIDPPLDAVLVPTRARRLAFLSEHLRATIDTNSRIRYQLLHRTASVVLEAVLHEAAVALVLVHAFGPMCPKNWDDYTAFLSQLGLSGVEPSRVTGPVFLGKEVDVPTYFLWCQDPIAGDAKRSLKL